MTAFAASNNLKNDFQVVAFGGGNFNKQEIKHIKSVGLTLQNIIHTEGSDSTLGKLYKNARAFIYPSLYEGFGLPLLEAMSQGCPILASNTSSIPEVVGTAGEYFTPSNIESIKFSLENTLYDGLKLLNLTEKGRTQIKHFSWEKCAQETLAAYRSI